MCTSIIGTLLLLPDSSPHSFFFFFLTDSFITLYPEEEPGCASQEEAVHMTKPSRGVAVRRASHDSSSVFPTSFFFNTFFSGGQQHVVLTPATQARVINLLIICPRYIIFMHDVPFLGTHHTRLIIYSLTCLYLSLKKEWCRRSHHHRHNCPTPQDGPSSVIHITRRDAVYGTS